jgi:hypothetical protein
MSAPILRDDWWRELLRLPDNWNGYGAKRITEAAISTLGSFAAVPTAVGGITLEVHRDGLDIEIEIGPDGRLLPILIGGAGQ